MFEQIRKYIVKNIIPNANALFVFVLIISGNFLADLFPCHIQNLMKNNIYMKHLFGFMILYFLTILTFPELKSIKGIISAFSLYILFLFSTKINYIAWAFVMIIYAFVYLLNIIVFDLTKKKNKCKKNKKKENEYHKKIINLKRIMSILIILNSIIIISGFLIRINRHKKYYKNNFSIYKFLMDIPNCKKKIPFN